ncbi:MAG: NUDIX domain-containing protein [Candidatus Nitrohelix vancouverensis]|uniref:NUDIX domain-containing protein n=1 Tax=Candidatus Nitrohelix vancouverensis TaxID=2705534 RepID=A0A7T0C3S6_9BACT|nr:MAG: NUDIX domain-containing protein [Candidatus Nitrohelix vancouverensis]
MDNGDEMFDVVDAQDHIIGQATRREVHQKGWMHRSVHIFVLNPAGDLFLQKRAESKDENPGLWDSSTSGHVDAGEDYDTAAHRELQEELGIKSDLKIAFSLSACPQTFNEHVRVYSCHTDQTIIINRDEISEGRFWTFEEIEIALQSPSNQFTSSFVLIWNRFQANTS